MSCKNKKGSKTFSMRPLIEMNHKQMTSKYCKLTNAIN